MELLETGEVVRFNTDIIKRSAFIRAKYHTWQDFCNGLVTRISPTELTVLFQTGINSSTSYYKIKASEIEAGLWTLSYSTDLTLGGTITMTGQIELENFKGLTSMPQKAASAWVAVSNLVGSSFVPLIYVGTQLAKGVNHWFIAEQTTSTANPTRRLVKLAVNEYNGIFALVPYSVEAIF